MLLYPKIIYSLTRLRLLYGIHDHFIVGHKKHNAKHFMNETLTYR